MLCDDLLGVEEYLHLTLLGTIFGSEELYLYRIQCRCRISLSSLQSLHTHECKIIIVCHFALYRGDMFGCHIDHISLIGHMDDLQICDACMFYELLTIGEEDTIAMVEEVSDLVEIAIDTISDIIISSEC